MSGSNVGRGPLSDQQWARNMEARMRQLEQRSALRAGSWTIVDIDGQLLAVKPGQEISLDGSPIRADVETILRGYATAPELTDVGRSIGRLTDMTVQNFLGDPGESFTLDEASAAQQTLYQSTQSNSQAVAQIITQITAQEHAGQNFTIDFSTYPDGPFPDDWDLTYSGPGTGYLGILRGRAHWYPVLDGDRFLFALYAPPGGGVTDSDYQHIGGTLSSAMGAGAKNGIFGRCNAAGDTYVFAEGTNRGLLDFRASLGCVVGGSVTMFASDIPAPANYNLSMWLGTADDERHFQVFSGYQPLIDFVDVANVSAMGANYRHWGFSNQTAGNGFRVPGGAVGVTCADAAPTP